MIVISLGGRCRSEVEARFRGDSKGDPARMIRAVAAWILRQILIFLGESGITAKNVKLPTRRRSTGRLPVDIDATLIVDQTLVATILPW